MSFVKISSDINGEIRRTALPNTFAELEQLISSSFKISSPMELCYKDDDDDMVRLESEADFQLAKSLMNMNLMHVRISKPKDVSQVQKDTAEEIFNEKVKQKRHERDVQRGSSPLFAALLSIGGLDNGAQLPPKTALTVTFTIKNTGKRAWPAGTVLKLVGGYRGNRLTSVTQVPVCSAEVPEGSEVVVSISMTTPSNSGAYFACWRLTTEVGRKFGPRISTYINVAPEEGDDYEMACVEGASTSAAGKIEPSTGVSILCLDKTKNKYAIQWGTLLYDFMSKGPKNPRRAENLLFKNHGDVEAAIQMFHSWKSAEKAPQQHHAAEGNKGPRHGGQGWKVRGHHAHRGRFHDQGRRAKRGAFVDPTASSSSSSSDEDSNAKGVKYQRRLARINRILARRGVTDPEAINSIIALHNGKLRRVIRYLKSIDAKY